MTRQRRSWRWQEIDEGRRRNDHATGLDATIVAHAPLTRRSTDTRSDRWRQQRHTETHRDNGDSRNGYIERQIGDKKNQKNSSCPQQYSQSPNAEQGAECVVGQVTDLVIIQRPGIEKAALMKLIGHRVYGGMGDIVRLDIYKSMVVARKGSHHHHRVCS